MRLSDDPETLATYCRDNALAVNIGGSLLLCRVLGAKPFYVPVCDQSITPHLAMSGFWDTDTTCFLIRTVRPGMTWANIGANVGYFSVLLSELTSDAAGVCYEPSFQPFQCLERNLRVNACWNAKAINAAIGATEGPNTMHIADDCLGGGSLLDSPYGFGTKHTQAITVQRFTEQVDFLFVDAEGMDLDIVLGLDYQPPHVVCEFAAKFTNLLARLPELFDVWNVATISAGIATPATPAEVIARGVVNLYLTAR